MNETVLKISLSAFIKYMLSLNNMHKEMYRQNDKQVRRKKVLITE